MLHGFTCNRRWWRHAGYVSAMGSDRQLILIDARGHGKSSKLDDAAGFEPELAAADVLSVMDAEGIQQADFVGYSLGGEVALDIAARHAERVRRLVLLSAHPYGTGPESLKFYQRWANMFQACGMPWWFAEATEMFGQYPAWCRREWLRECARSMAAQATAFGHLPDVSAQVAAAHVPLLQIAGGEEPALERYKSVAELGSPGQFTALAGLDHLDVFLRSDLVVPHVRTFLNSVTDR